MEEIPASQPGRSFEDEIRRLMNAFPSLASWFGKFEQEQADGVREAWRKQLSSTDLEDLSSVVDSLIEGSVEMPPNYEYDRVALMIRRESQQLKNLRNRTAKRIELCQREERPDRARARRWRVAMTVSGDFGIAKEIGLISEEQNTAGVDAADRFMRCGDGLITLTAEQQRQVDRFKKELQP